MAFVSEIFDELRDLLTDPADSQVTFATKKLYVNHAIARMWPKVYSIASTNVALTAGTYEYALGAAVVDGMILSVEINTLVDTLTYHRFDRYDVIPGDEDLAGKLVLIDNPVTGTTIRIRYAAPIPQVSAASYAAAQSETWSGPDRALRCPVAYAMSRCTLRKLDDRQDTLRYSTTQATNGVTDQDIIAAAQNWMAEFELELDNLERPLPPARD